MEKKLYTCLCGNKAELTDEEFATSKWTRAGNIYICEDCGKKPDRLSKSSPVEKTKKTEEIIMKPKEPEVVQVYKTSDGRIHATEESAREHARKIHAREKIHELINDPHFFSIEMLDKIIDNAEKIWEIVKNATNAEN